MLLTNIKLFNGTFFWNRGSNYSIEVSKKRPDKNPFHFLRRKSSSPWFGRSIRCCKLKKKMWKDQFKWLIEKGNSTENSRSRQSNLPPTSNLIREWPTTMCIRDWDKLNLICWFDFRLEPIRAIMPQMPQKIWFTSKVVKGDQKVIVAPLLPRSGLNPWYTL